METYVSRGTGDTRAHRAVLSPMTCVSDVSWVMTTAWMDAVAAEVGWTTPEVEAVITGLFVSEATNLVRLARFFVDDRDAAEDLVQEAFIRLARSLHRINDESRRTAYLRSIVLNLARDHNRRGLVSLRHQMRSDAAWAPTVDDEIAGREDQRQVIAALRELPPGQRNPIVLRYYLDLPIMEIAATLGVSPNTVKTQLQRGMANLERLLGDTA